MMLTIKQGWVGVPSGSVRRTARRRYEAVRIGTSMAAIRVFETEREARAYPQQAAEQARTELEALL
jgi:hypothetical protein